MSFSMAGYFQHKNDSEEVSGVIEVKFIRNEWKIVRIISNHETFVKVFSGL